MPDLDDLLRRDGVQWRAEVERRHAAVPGLHLDRITAGPAPVRTPRDRFSGRAPLLLSMAAVTVAALTVGDVVLTSGARHPHTTSPPFSAAGASPSVSFSPSTSNRPSSATTAPRAHHSTAAHRSEVGAASATATRAKRPTKKKHLHSAGRSVSTSAAAPIACDDANLAITISSPVPSDDRAALTVSLMNNGLASCTIGGFPAVQFAGATTISATPTTDPPASLTLAGRATASAEVDWGATSADGPCPGYATALVSTPVGGSVQLPLDPAAQVCDATTFVVHPLIAS